MLTTYQIPAENFEWLKEKIAKLNRRFKKIGQKEGIQLEVIREYSVQRKVDGDRRLEIFHYYEVAVHGEPPKAQGWEMLAQIEHSEAGNIIRALPGVTIAEEWRVAQPYCEHCKVKRYRSDTFLLKHESGKIAQIGRNCIKDFLGHIDPQIYAIWAKYSRELDEIIDEYSRPRKPLYDLIIYLQWVCAVVREKGSYVSKSKAKENEGSKPTSELAERYMMGDDYLTVNEPIEIIDADVETANAAIAWLRETLQNSSEINNYMHNLKTIIDLPGIEQKHFGFVASIYGSWKKAMEDRATKEVEERRKEKSDHIGIIGTRETFILTYLSCISFETPYGIKYIEKFADDSGNIAVWKTYTGGWFDGQPLIPGNKYKVKATVKDHSEYNGVKQTEISRVTVLETITSRMNIE
jgi:hypothetical protein